MTEDHSGEQQRRIFYVGPILVVFIGWIGFIAVYSFHELLDSFTLDREFHRVPVINPVFIVLLYAGALSLLFYFGWVIYLALK